MNSDCDFPFELLSANIYDELEDKEIVRNRIRKCFIFMIRLE